MAKSNDSLIDKPSGESSQANASVAESKHVPALRGDGCDKHLRELADLTLREGKVAADVVNAALLESYERCNPPKARPEVNQLVATLEKNLPKAVFQPQTFDAFIQKELPSKEALIEGVLYRRDLISLTGRRRNGKTTLLCNLALAGQDCKSIWALKFLTHSQRYRSFYLEDDPREMQDKLQRMRRGAFTQKFHLYLREDFQARKISIGMRKGKNANSGFFNFIQQACNAAKPDLIILDNLGQLIFDHRCDPLPINPDLADLLALSRGVGRRSAIRSPLSDLFRAQVAQVGDSRVGR